MRGMSPSWDVASARRARRLPIGEEHPSVDRDGAPRWRRADHHAATAGSRDPDAGCDHVGVTDDLERDIHAARHQRSDGLGEIVAFAEVHGVGGPQQAGKVELPGVRVEHDDPTGAGDPRPLDDREAHAAAADDQDGFACADLGHVEHRSEAGGDTASPRGR